MPQLMYPVSIILIKYNNQINQSPFHHHMLTSKWYVPSTFDFSMMTSMKITVKADTPNVKFLQIKNFNIGKIKGTKVLFP